ncbi:HNH endonuclease signature motif containing protein [Bacillus sp. BSL6]|uniref:HNH endonuclease n=1 Tax=unclassified Bacillus (in: firmicutes) TaxID=185979 RepID=UPI0030FB695F
MNNNTIEVEMKVCRKCKNKLPADSIHFRKHNTAKDRLEHVCKKCRGYELEKETTEEGKTLKLCPICEREFPANKVYFTNSKAYEDGFYYCCKKCNGGKFGIGKMHIMNKAKEGYKVCSKCKQELPMDTVHFRRRSERKDGYESSCKVCMGSRFKETDFIAKKDGFKVCTLCMKELPATEEYFTSDKTKKDGLHSHCKICSGRKSYGVKQPNKVYEVKEGHKICTVCINELPYSNFNSCSSVKDGHYHMCKECYRKYEKTGNRKRLKKINNQKRRTRKKHSLQYYNAEIWDKTLEYFNHECAYCGRNEELVQEHVIPLKKGGSYTRQNIIPACCSCNNSKYINDLEQWYLNQSFFDQKRLDKIHKWIGYNTKNKSQQLSIL